MTLVTSNVSSFSTGTEVMCCLSPGAQDSDTVWSKKTLLVVRVWWGLSRFSETCPRLLLFQGVFLICKQLCCRQAAEARHCSKGSRTSELCTSFFSCSLQLFLGAADEHQQMIMEPLEKLPSLAPLLQQSARNCCFQSWQMTMSAHDFVTSGQIPDSLLSTP